VFREDDVQYLFNVQNPVVIEFSEITGISVLDIAQHEAMSNSTIIPNAPYPVRWVTIGCMATFIEQIKAARSVHQMMHDERTFQVIKGRIDLPTDKEIRDLAQTLLDQIASHAD